MTTHNIEEDITYLVRLLTERLNTRLRLKISVHEVARLYRMLVNLSPHNYYMNARYNLALASYYLLARNEGLSLRRFIKVLDDVDKRQLFRLLRMVQPYTQYEYDPHKIIIRLLKTRITDDRRLLQLALRFLDTYNEYNSKYGHVRMPSTIAALCHYLALETLYADANTNRRPPIKNIAPLYAIDYKHLLHMVNYYRSSLVDLIMHRQHGGGGVGGTVDDNVANAKHTNTF